MEHLHSSTWRTTGPLADRDLLIMAQDKKVSDYRQREWLHLPQQSADNTQALGSDGFDLRRTGLGPKLPRQRDRIKPVAAGKVLNFECTMDALRPQESVVHGGKRAHSGAWQRAGTQQGGRDDDVEAWAKAGRVPGRMSSAAHARDTTHARPARDPYVLVTTVSALEQESVEGWHPAKRFVD